MILALSNTYKAPLYSFSPTICYFPFLGANILFSILVTNNCNLFAHYKATGNIRGKVILVTDHGGP
jgi:hypothetical protein